MSDRKCLGVAMDLKNSGEDSLIIYQWHDMAAAP